MLQAEKSWVKLELLAWFLTKDTYRMSSVVAWVLWLSLLGGWDSIILSNRWGYE